MLLISPMNLFKRIERLITGRWIEKWNTLNLFKRIERKYVLIISKSTLQILRISLRELKGLFSRPRPLQDHWGISLRELKVDQSPNLLTSMIFPLNLFKRIERHDLQNLAIFPFLWNLFKRIERYIKPIWIISERSMNLFKRIESLLLKSLLYWLTPSESL